MSTSTLKEPNVSQSKDVENGKDNSVKSCITKPVLNGNKCANKEEKAPSACHDAGAERSMIREEETTKLLRFGSGIPIRAPNLHVSDPHP